MSASSSREPFLALDFGGAWLRSAVVVPGAKPESTYVHEVPTLADDMAGCMPNPVSDGVVSNWEYTKKLWTAEANLAAGSAKAIKSGGVLVAFNYMPDSLDRVVALQDTSEVVFETLNAARTAIVPATRLALAAHSRESKPGVVLHLGHTQTVVSAWSTAWDRNVREPVASASMAFTGRDMDAAFYTLSGANEAEWRPFELLPVSAQMRVFQARQKHAIARASAASCDMPAELGVPPTQVDVAEARWRCVEGLFDPQLVQSLIRPNVLSLRPYREFPTHGLHQIAISVIEAARAARSDLPWWSCIVPSGGVAATLQLHGVLKGYLGSSGSDCVVHDAAERSSHMVLHGAAALGHHRACPWVTRDQYMEAGRMWVTAADPDAKPGPRVLRFASEKRKRFGKKKKKQEPIADERGDSGSVFCPSCSRAFIPGAREQCPYCGYPDDSHSFMGHVDATNISYLVQPDEALLCCICECAAWEPIMLACCRQSRKDAVFCVTCIKDYCNQRTSISKQPVASPSSKGKGEAQSSGEHVAATCPSCSIPLPPLKRLPHSVYFPPREVVHQLNQLPVRCPFSDRGCSVKGLVRRDLIQHANVCPSAGSASELVLGIDLGTTYSVASVLHTDTGEVNTLRIDGMDTLPSVITYTFGSTIPIVGHQAVTALRQNSRCVLFYDAKRFIGRPYGDAKKDLHRMKKVAKDVDPMAGVTGSGEYPFRVKKGSVGNVTFSASSNGITSLPPEDVSAHVLRMLRDTARRTYGVPLVRAVITVPAHFQAPQRAATRSAARKAGLDVVKIIDEPTAAAIAYTYQSQLNRRKRRRRKGVYGDDVVREGNVFVYDLGGGTFDATVVRLHQGSDHSVTQKSLDGDSHLGGQDWDLMLRNWVLEQIDEKYMLVDGTWTRHQLECLRLSCKFAKERLSTLEETTIGLDFVALAKKPDKTSRFKKGKKDVERVQGKVNVTREQFEACTKVLLDRTMSLVDSVLSEAQKAGVKQIHQVLLVGGSSKMPAVQAAVEAKFKKKFPSIHCTLSDPDLCVAKGAAILGHMLTRQHGEQAESVSVHGILPHTIGLKVAGSPPKSSPIFSRGEALASLKPVLRSYQASQSSANVLHMIVLEGESEIASECTSVCTEQVTITPGEICKVTWSFDNDGILQMRAQCGEAIIVKSLSMQKQTKENFQKKYAQRYRSLLTQDSVFGSRVVCPSEPIVSPVATPEPDTGMVPEPRTSTSSKGEDFATVTKSACEEPARPYRVESLTAQFTHTGHLEVSFPLPEAVKEDISKFKEFRVLVRRGRLWKKEHCIPVQFTTDQRCSEYETIKWWVEDDCQKECAVSVALGMEENGKVKVGAASNAASVQPFEARRSAFKRFLSKIRKKSKTDESIANLQGVVYGTTGAMEQHRNISLLMENIRLAATKEMGKGKSAKKSTKRSAKKSTKKSTKKSNTDEG